MKRRVPEALKRSNAKILIADDEPSITDGLERHSARRRLRRRVATDGQKALERLIARRFGVVLADLKMPKLDGLALLKELQRSAIPTECIIITGQATVDSAVQAMREGAYDYIEKPLNAEKLNRLKALIPKALDKFNVQQKNRELSSQARGAHALRRAHRPVRGDARASIRSSTPSRRPRRAC